MPPLRASSPHRFLADRPQSQSRFGPESFRRDQDAQRTTSHVPPHQEGASAPVISQFAATPRFGRQKQTLPHEREHEAPASSTATTVKAFRASTRRGEEIEDTHSSDEDNDDDMAVLGTDMPDCLPSEEAERLDSEVNPVWARDVALSPKRRKLDAMAQELTREQWPLFRRPELPVSPANARTSSTAFLPTQESISASAVDHESPALSRPTFLPPPPASTEHAGPLPQVFSPHRRGHKFVPGGMALTVQQWVIEAGHAVVESRRARGNSRDEEFVYKVYVEKVRGCGPITALGRSITGEKIDLLFPNRNDGGAIDGKADRVVSGAIVGVRQPTWELQLDGIRWNVVVDWNVLT